MPTRCFPGIQKVPHLYLFARVMMFDEYLLGLLMLPNCRITFTTIRYRHVYFDWTDTENGKYYKQRQLFTIFCQCYKESLFRWSFIWRVFQRLCLLNFCHAYKISKYHNNGNIWMLYIPLLTWFDCIFPSLPIWLLLFMTLFVSSLLSLFLRKLHISHVQRRVINPTYLIEI